jgi:hypothetical protein
MASPNRMKLPAPGRYRDQLGRVMVTDASTRGAWQLAHPKTQTGRYAKAIVAHRFSEGWAEWDGALDQKAMKELIRLGIEEGLIEMGPSGRAKDVSRFLDELRPFQLDVVLEGREELHRLQREAHSTREFFEIGSRWPSGQVWSDGIANDMLSRELRRGTPPDTCAIGRSRG